MTAPELSAEEAARVAEFERAPDAPESFRETVVAAIAASLRKQVANGYIGRLECEYAADAAIAAIGALAGPGETEAAVRRVEALADDLDGAARGALATALPHSRPGAQDRARLYRDLADHIRATLRGDA